MTIWQKYHDDRTDEDIDLTYEVDDQGWYRLQPNDHSLLDLVPIKGVVNFPTPAPSSV